MLRLQIIGTINGHAADIDPALPRPVDLPPDIRFARFRSRHAAAVERGRTLNEAREHSLAELFAEAAPNEVGRGRIGFAG